MDLTYKKNVSLAPYTSFKVGGLAEYFIEVHSSDELLSVLQKTDIAPIWLLGYGSNSLISDDGLPGLTIATRGGDIAIEGHNIIADAGVWWDDIVSAAVDNSLWGAECMSYIPGSFGASLAINITAYGQSVGPLVEWIDVWDTERREIKRLTQSDLEWGYKSSIFQTQAFRHFVIIKAKIRLSQFMTNELTYQKALDVAEELHLGISNLGDRRKIIFEARMRAGSIWDEKFNIQERTVGSFFRNPLVDATTAEKIIAFDESGKTAEQIKQMNKVHGGDTHRVSAAHVLLASGFKRGQSWGPVKLNDKNLLKIEATDGATAQDIYNVMKLLQQSCQEKTGIQLVPEAQLLGRFVD